MLFRLVLMVKVRVSLQRMKINRTSSTRKIVYLRLFIICVPHSPPASISSADIGRSKFKVLLSLCFRQLSIHANRGKPPRTPSRPVLITSAPKGPSTLLIRVRSRLSSLITTTSV